VNRAEQKRETRSAILAKARDLFERQGFDATAIRDVASAAGVAAGTVLLHFPDKTDLLHAALFDELTVVIDETLGAVPAGPLERKLGHVTRRMFAYYERRPTLSRSLLSSSLFAAEPWAGRFSAQTAKVHAALVGMIEQAVARGELVVGTESQTFAAAYLSFYYFALIAWVQGAHAEPVALVARLVRQQLVGLRQSPHASSPRQSSSAVAAHKRARRKRET
jgi:AcrR family transcriptional regulator